MAQRDGVEVPDQERVGSGRRGVAERLDPLVCQRAGERCRSCRRGTIERIVVGGRGTYLCARCQPAPDPLRRGRSRASA